VRAVGFVTVARLVAVGSRTSRHASGASYCNATASSFASSDVDFAIWADRRSGPMIELTHSRRPAVSGSARCERCPNPEGKAWKMKP
jgi:hypothetical protein